MDKIYYQMKTMNHYFLDTYKKLKRKGIKNCKAHLILLDPDLNGVDPYDPNLPGYMKVKIIKECFENYWYFLREVIRVPAMTMPKDEGDHFNLGIVAFSINFLFSHEYTHIIAVNARQQRTDLSFIAREIYNSTFKPNHKNIRIYGKKIEDSRLLVSKHNEIIRLLPDYIKALPNSIKYHVFGDNNNTIGLLNENDIFMNNVGYTGNFDKLLKASNMNDTPSSIRFIHGYPSGNQYKSYKPLKKLFEKSDKFELSMVDLPAESLPKKGTNFIAVSFNYNEIGLTSKAKKHMRLELCSRQDIIDRELELKWE